MLSIHCPHSLKHLSAVIPGGRERCPGPNCFHSSRAAFSRLFFGIMLSVYLGGNHVENLHDIYAYIGCKDMVEDTLWNTRIVQKCGIVTRFCTWDKTA